MPFNIKKYNHLGHRRVGALSVVPHPRNLMALAPDDPVLGFKPRLFLIGADHTDTAVSLVCQRELGAIGCRFETSTTCGRQLTRCCHIQYTAAASRDTAKILAKSLPIASFQSS